MLMNNGVNLNNVIMLWGELNVITKKCNYQSKEKCIPMKNLHGQPLYFSYDVDLSLIGFYYQSFP